MNIIKATDKHKEAIFKIWLSCFTEDEAYIYTYLEYCFPNTTTLLLGDDNIGFVSVISIIPSYFVKNNKIIRGGYLYGVGTLPHHRGQSYSSELVNYAIALLKSEGADYFIVKPASEALFKLYRRFGFTKPIYKTNYTIPADNELSRTIIKTTFADNIVRLADINDIDKLYQARERYLTNTNFLWPKEVLRYSFLEILNRDGFILLNQETDDYCTGYPAEEKDSLVILEATISPDVVNLYFGNGIKEKYPHKNNWSIDSYYTKSIKKDPTLSALLMELSPGIYEHCSELNLSLPME